MGSFHLNRVKTELKTISEIATNHMKQQSIYYSYCSCHRLSRLNKVSINTTAAGPSPLAKRAATQLSKLSTIVIFIPLGFGKPPSYKKQLISSPISAEQTYMLN